jgi:23S rRNA (uracil1939-C5)-methyltransferase
VSAGPLDPRSVRASAGAPRYKCAVTSKIARAKAHAAVLDARVRDVTESGDSVLETSAGIVLARGGLPGEQVRVRVLEARAGVLRGLLQGISSASADRIEPRCPITARCGGCPLMSLALPAQHRLKIERVQRAVAGLGAGALPVQLEAAGPAFGYRRRARFGFRMVGKVGMLGYRVAAKHAIVDVSECVVLEPALARALRCVRATLLPLLVGSGEIELNALDLERVAVAVHCDAAVAPEFYRAVERLVGQAPIVSATLQVEAGAAARFGVSTPELGVSGLPPSAADDGFSQVNAAVNVRLVELVLALAEAQGARVLELYAGQGNFTLGLAAEAATLVAVEANASAAQACRQNLRARGLGQARVIASPVEKAALPARCDVLVLDPPRGGCPEIAGIAARLKPARIVYVSCSMTTLTRDLRALLGAGYSADRVHALDMFPHTGHVEAIVRLRLGDAAAPADSGAG